MIGFIAPCTFTQFGTTGNTALSLFYTLSSSPLHTHEDSQPSLVVSWQRIYQSLAVILNHTWSFLDTIWFLSCHFFSITLDCHLQNSTQFPSDYCSVLLASLLQLLLPYRTLRTTTLHGSHRNAIFFCPECVFTGPLPSNGCPIVERLFCRNVFTDPLSSNGYTRHNIREKYCLRIPISEITEWASKKICIGIFEVKVVWWVLIVFLSV
jgi:hypothetical protein